MTATKRPLFDPPIVRRAIRDSFVKLAPRHMVRNPVMFVVLVGSVFTTVVLLRDLIQGTRTTGFTLQLALWLWFTVLFANFAEAMAEGRGKAQADDAAENPHADTQAKRLGSRANTGDRPSWCPPARSVAATSCSARPATSSRATARWSTAWRRWTSPRSPARSAPVIRESGGDRSAVTGGTKVLSD